MGLLDKVKNLFTEEVEVEEEVKPKQKPKKEKKKKEEPIQKEVIKVEIPSPKETKEKRSEINVYDEYTEVEEQREDDYKFPFFDDDDFDVVKTEEKPKKEEKLYQKEVYNPPKEEKKVFTPSPIISPVYGFLDKDYQKEEIVKKKNDYHSRRATVDELREKAYGSLESDIETTLFGAQRVTFDDTKELDNVNKELKKIEKEVTPKMEKPRHQKNAEEDDLTDLLEAEMAKPEKEEKPKKSRKISDKELFNLIDSMYEGEIK